FRARRSRHLGHNRQTPADLGQQISQVGATEIGVQKIFHSSAPDESPTSFVGSRRGGGARKARQGSAPRPRRRKLRALLVIEFTIPLTASSRRSRSAYCEPACSDNQARPPRE